MTLPGGDTFPGAGLLPAELAPIPPSDGRSTVYQIGDWCGVNNGQPYVDAFGCWWQVTREEGWSGAPATRADVFQWPYRKGQSSSNVQENAREILIGGTIRAGDQQTLQGAIDRASALLASTGHVDTLRVAEPHTTRSAIVYRRDATPVAKVSPYLARFLFQLVADDPRRLGDPVSVSTGLPSASGGFRFPLRFPFTIASTIVSGRCSLTNPGLDTGPVTMRIDGPVQGPIVTHVGTGRALVFATSLALGAGEWIDVDMENQLVLANGTATRAGSITRSEWSGFDPGENVWAFSAAAYNPSARLTVTARAA